MRHSVLVVAIIAFCSQPISGQARVVSAPGEPSLLNLTGSWSRASTLGDLREMRTRSDHLELRAWRGYGASETRAVVLRRAEGRWSASLARVIRCEIQIPRSIGDTAKAATMRQFVIEAKRNCGASVVDVSAGSQIIAADTLIVQQLDAAEAELSAAWNDMLVAGAMELPPRVKRTRTVDEGMTYVFELRRGNEYRAAEIEYLERPEVKADSQMTQIYGILQRLLPR